MRVSARPRPVGASGRVTTATTSCREPSTAVSDGTAASGVPAKTMRSGLTFCWDGSLGRSTAVDSHRRRATRPAGRRQSATELARVGSTAVRLPTPRVRSRIEPVADCRPLGDQDREHDGVAEGSVGAADGAGAGPPRGRRRASRSPPGSAGLAGRSGSSPGRSRSRRRRAEQQPLAFRIDGGAPDRRRVGRPAEMDPLVGHVDVVRVEVPTIRPAVPRIDAAVRRTVYIARLPRRCRRRGWPPSRPRWPAAPPGPPP